MVSASYPFCLNEVYYWPHIREVNQELKSRYLF